MDNLHIASEKRIKIVIGILGFSFLFLIYHIADVMFVAPAFLESSIAHAPREEPMGTLSLAEFMSRSHSE